jgi:hypothetical protein
MAYVYRITHKETKEYYIGYHRRGLTIGKDYWTSSNLISFNKDNVHEWHIEIIWTGGDEECWHKEQSIIRECIKDELCLNRNYSGPDGVYKYRVDEEQRRRMSESHKRRWTDELRAERSAQTKQNWASKSEEEKAELRAVTSKSLTAYWEGNESAREERSEELKERWSDPEYKAKHAAVNRDSRKRYWADPVWAAAQVEKMKANTTRGPKMAALWKDPIWREKILSKRRGRKNPRVSCIVCRKDIAAPSLDMHQRGARCRKKDKNNG